MAWGQWEKDYWMGLAEENSLIEDMTEAIKVIRQCIATAQSRQKSYVDVWHRPLEFAVGDYVFIKVAPMKGIMRFSKKGKLSPRYVGPFEVIERVGQVAYKLDLPSDMFAIHDVFHISMLKKYIADPDHVIAPQTIQI